MERFDKLQNLTNRGFITLTIGTVFFSFAAGNILTKLVDIIL